jgi:hypothetical protein
VTIFKAFFIAKNKYKYKKGLGNAYPAPCRIFKAKEVPTHTPYMYIVAKYTTE